VSEQRIARGDEHREFHSTRAGQCPACADAINVGDVIRKVHGRYIHNRPECRAATPHPGGNLRPRDQRTYADLDYTRSDLPARTLAAYRQGRG
jgi:hypothetical protein